jgi:hypothetical protein
MITLVSFYNFIRFTLVIFLLYSLLTVFCPTVAFALTPEEVIDYYGDIEFIGKDPYGHFHDPITYTNNYTINQDVTCIQGDSYGSSPPFEKD